MALTSPKRLGRLLLVILVLGIVFLPVANRAFHRDTCLREALSRLQPGLEHSEVRALLTPIRADNFLPDGKSAGSYFFRGIDEFVEIEMDGWDEDARVRRVNHIADTGPWWENARRNWEWCLR
jgi:hypothetical protein